MVVHLSFLLAKQLLMKLFSKSLQTYANSIAGIVATQRHPYSMCQAMPTGLYTRSDFDSETTRFTLRQNKNRSFENLVMSYFQRTRPERKIESSFTTCRPKETDPCTVDGFFSLLLSLQLCVWSHGLLLSLLSLSRAASFSHWRA